MDKLTFLGTASAMAYHCYTTSIALTNEQQVFITDGGSGNGILLQLEKANIPLDRIGDIFISHCHTDHIVGVIWLVRAIGHQFDRQQRMAPLTLYGHATVLDTFRQISDLLMPRSVIGHFDRTIHFRPVTSGETLPIGTWQITFFDTGAKKTLQYGWQAKLSNGETLTFLGDEPLKEAGIPYCQNTDYLIHEAFCLAADEDKYQPHRINHSTVLDAVENATRLGVKHLILFHGEDDIDGTRQARYLAEAVPHFNGYVSVPNDLDTITLQAEENHDNSI